MKQHHYPWLTQALYLAPLACVTLAGCQGLATSSLVLLQPPTLAVAPAAQAMDESAPPLGPGTSVSTPTRLAQPTLTSTTDMPPSAAPGSLESRSGAQARTLLLKATAALDVHDWKTASGQLRRYVLLYPDAVLIRMQLGELLYKQQLYDEAATEFRAALGEVADPSLPLHCKLHGHSRLVEIATDQQDRFHEALHRGIGLLLLAERRLTTPPQQNEVTGEQLLGKAHTALVKASKLSPNDARPALYLIQVWHLMLQPGNARAAYSHASQLSTITSLSATEQLWLAQWGLDFRQR